MIFIWLSVLVCLFVVYEVIVAIAIIIMADIIIFVMIAIIMITNTTIFIINSIFNLSLIWVLPNTVTVDFFGLSP